MQMSLNWEFLFFFQFNLNTIVKVLIICHQKNVRETANVKYFQAKKMMEKDCRNNNSSRKALNDQKNYQPDKKSYQRKLVFKS